MKKLSAFNNAKWVGLSQITKIFVQVVALVGFSRILQPGEYGIMAMAAVISNFAIIFRDLGTGSAIIQKKKIDDGFLSSLFWMNMIVGGGIMIIIMIISPLVAVFFHESQLTYVLILLSISFPLASLGIIHQSYLERNNKFSQVCFVEMISAIFALGIGIATALLGGGVYSLVIMTVIQTLISSVGFWFVSNWTPSFSFDKKDINDVLNFSGNLTLFNLVNYFSRNSDNMIIGHYFSTSILGAYSLAYRIMLFPLQSLTSVASRSLYPVISRMKNNNEGNVTDLYLRTLSFISIFTLPLMAGLWLLSDSFVSVVFGEKWILVSSILFWLAPTGFIQSLVSTTGTIYMAYGKVGLLFKLGVFSSFLQIFAFIVGAQYNVIVLAKLYFISNLINFFVAMYFTLKLLSGNLMQLLIKLLPTIFCTIVMLFVVAVIKCVLKHYNYNDITLLIS
ncbi:O32 family O-antigen flippase, partial [Escherichia coli]